MDEDSLRFYVLSSAGANKNKVTYTETVPGEYLIVVNCSNRVDYNYIVNNLQTNNKILSNCYVVEPCSLLEMYNYILECGLEVFMQSVQYEQNFRCSFCVYIHISVHELNYLMLKTKNCLYAEIQKAYSRKNLFVVKSMNFYVHTCYSEENMNQLVANLRQKKILNVNLI